MTQPKPSLSQDNGPFGVLFWQIVNAKSSADQAAEQCTKALRQLAIIRNMYASAPDAGQGGEEPQVRPGDPGTQG